MANPVHMARPDNIWGGHVAWAPVAHFSNSAEDIGNNMVSDFNTITRMALGNDIQLQALWAVGGALYDSVGGRFTQASVPSARDAIVAHIQASGGDEASPGPLSI
ncbi:unnamed protein product [Fusarium equiseti]|uniref:Uncharacterized protein n=1 Tax=Fusarium equiseti TaxID=61235 RepID=A0A8J2N9U1_FUSEQ|nr:unnamed protein product [Fusarium equiseti]